MKIDWRKVTHLAATIVGQVIPGVAVVEQIASQFGTLRGKDKQDAVAELVKASLEAAESVSGRDLARDEDVDKATRAVIDAVVALHNVVARKSVAPLL